MTLRQSFASYGMDELLAWVSDRRLPLMFERSVRLQPETFENRRCLFSLPVAAMTDTALSEVLQICRAMSSPELHLLAIQRFFRSAEHVHFGFEYSGTAVIGKCYLELPLKDSIDHSVCQLRFLGYKWSMHDRSVAVVSRYRLLPMIDWEQVQQTMLQQVDGAFKHYSSQLLTALQPNSLQVESSNFSLLEVTEEGSDRRSYDLNVYDLQHKIADIAGSLRNISEDLNCDQTAVDYWFNCHQAATVGHVALGQSRQRQPFVTLYYSADLQAFA